MWNIVRSLSINKLVAGGSWKREGVMRIYLLADQSSTPVFLILISCFLMLFCDIFLCFFFGRGDGYLCGFSAYKLSLES